MSWRTSRLRPMRLSSPGCVGDAMTIGYARHFIEDVAALVATALVTIFILWIIMGGAL